MPLGTASSARLTLSRASDQPLASDDHRDAEADCRIDPQPSLAMISSAATTTPSDTPASAAMCR